MASKRIRAIDLQRAVEKVLEQYGEKANSVMDKSVETVAQAAADKLRGHRKFNPRRNPSGKYAASWVADRTEKRRIYTNWVVHNVEHYRLTHLLEKGHVSRNGTGRSYGRVKDYPHISEVNDWVQKALPEEVEWRLGNDL